MAVLLERLVRKDVDPELPSWRYTPGRSRVTDLPPGAAEPTTSREARAAARATRPSFPPGPPLPPDRSP